MDTDQVFDVPDTPDRLAKQNINGRGFIEKQSDSAVASHSGKVELLGEGARNQLRGRSKVVDDDGRSRRPSLQPVKKPLTLSKSNSGLDFKNLLGNSSSSESLFRRMEVDKIGNDKNKSSLHCQSKEGKGKALWTSTSRGTDCLLFSSSKNPMDSNSSSKPTSEFQQPDQEKEQQIRGEEKKEEILVSALRIKIPSTTTLGEFDHDEECSTPTSTDRRIPSVLPCPPAPRKPKPAKRKAADSRPVWLDFSKEVEALFPSSVIADFGGKIKKARKND